MQKCGWFLTQGAGSQVPPSEESRSCVWRLQLLEASLQRPWHLFGGSSCVNWKALPGEGKRQARPFINSPFEHSQRRGVSQQGREAPADGAIRCQHVPHTGLKPLSSMVGRPSHAVVAYSMDGSQTARREDDHLRGGQGEGIFPGKPISTSSEDVIHWGVHHVWCVNAVRTPKPIWL